MDHPQGLGGCSKRELILGDGGLKTFEVSPPPLHILLHFLLGGFLRLTFASLREVIELSSEPSLELPNIIQQALYLLSVLKQDPINNLLKCEATCLWGQEELRQSPLPC